MNKFLKITFLVITLAIPLGIFIFLRLFGENKFEIPVYYQEGLTDEVTNCEQRKGPFVVPDSLLAGHGPSLVIFYEPQHTFDSLTFTNQTRRLRELFGEDLPEIIVYSRQLLPQGDFQSRILKKEALKRTMQCGFILDDFNRYVLVDRKNRIRGYYGTDREETDRLIVEIKILLENGTR